MRRALICSNYGIVVSDLVIFIFYKAIKGKGANAMIVSWKPMLTIQPILKMGRIACVALFMLLCTNSALAGEIGWVVSRANCINNESFTWRVITPPEIIQSIMDLDLDANVFKYAWRATYAEHLDRYWDSDHQRIASKEYTWRSVAWDKLEGLPIQIWVLYVVHVFYPDWFSDHPFSYSYYPRISWIPVIVVDRWIVNAWHLESFTNYDWDYTERTTSTMGCDWDKTFNTESY